MTRDSQEKAHAELVESRAVPVDGVFNFRDVGGLPRTGTDEPIIRGVLYRSDDLGWISGPGVETIEALGIKTVIDLRTSMERADFPSPFDAHPNIRLIDINLAGDPIEDAPSVPGDEYPIVRTARLYWSWLIDRPEYLSRLFRALVQPAATPAVFHCVGGKDRTGMVAALIQSLLGTPRQIIVADYVLSARNNGQRILDGFDPMGRDWGFETVDEFQAKYCPLEAMHIVLMLLEACYGSAEGYLSEIGVPSAEMDQLRNLLTKR